MSDAFNKMKEMFGASTEKDGAIDYSHASEEKLRQAMGKILSQSPTGARLLKMAQEQHIDIKILRGKGDSGYIPENRAVYISFPQQLSTIPPEKILELGAFLRQAELQISGIKNPDNSMSSVEKGKSFDKKIMDNLIIMCQIADDMKQKGTTQFLDALSHMGHADFYGIYSKHGLSQELIDQYYKTYVKQ